MEFEHGIVALTEHPEVLARLKRLGILKYDKERKKDFYTTQFDGRFLTFYVGESRTFPASIARALEASNHTHIELVCDHCKGKGSTVAGLCINCKGKKMVSDDRLFRTLKVIRTYDAMLVDPESIRERVSATPAPETDTAIA